MKRISTRIGDVFSTAIDKESKKYLQYVANDLSQLNSDVIRVFKRVYSNDEKPNLSDLVNGEVEFYAHCVTKWGIKLGYWERVGNVSDVGTISVLFRDTNDYGLGVKVSKNWYVWKINQEFQRVGELKGENRRAEIGVVIAPDSIVHRMKTGKYDFVYPAYR